MTVQHLGGVARFSFHSFSYRKTNGFQ